MTSIAKILCFVLWLTTVCPRTDADLPFTTESNEEKEKEKELKFMDENETLFVSTPSPDNFSLPKPVLEDMIDLNREREWWENDTSFTDYDELHSHGKPDSSPENSVDRDHSLQNFNNFLTEHPSLDHSVLDFRKKSTPLEIEESFLSNETTVPLSESKHFFTRSSCNFGDRKCTVMVLESSNDLSLTGQKPATSSAFDNGKLFITPSMISLGSTENSQLVGLKTTIEVSNMFNSLKSLSEDFNSPEKTTPMPNKNDINEFTDSSRDTTKRISESIDSTEESTKKVNKSNDSTEESIKNILRESNNSTDKVTKTLSTSEDYFNKTKADISELNENATTVSFTNEPIDRTSAFININNNISELSENNKSVITEIPIIELAENFTPVVIESTNDHSENLILVESSEVVKDESVIRGQLSKADKSRQLTKQVDQSHSPNENFGRMFFKTDDEETDHIVEKDSDSISSTPLHPYSLLTKSNSIEWTERDFSPSKPLGPFSTIPYASMKPNILTFSDSNLKKVIVEEADVELKTHLGYHTPLLDAFSTISWQLDVKSSDSVLNVKVAKEDKFSETMTVLSPSFMPLPTSQLDTLIRQKSVILSQQRKSEGLLDFSTVLKSSEFTPVLKTLIVSSQNNKVTNTTPTAVNNDTFLKAIPPPRLSYPGCSSLPVCVEITLLETSWEQFCSQRQELQEFLSKSVSHYTRPIRPHHIVLDASCHEPSFRSSPDVTAAFYVTNDAGEYEERMTEICGLILRKWAPSSFKSTVIEIRFYNSEVQATPLPIIPELNSGFVAAVSISAVAGVALCLLCILLVIMKQKLMQGRTSDATTPAADAYSLDSLSISASFRRRRNRRSARSYLNHAFNDQDIPSHPLNEKTLGNCVKSKDLLEEEFRRIPMTMPKLDSIPEGAHVKNRYSNILPKAETRVVLADPSGDPLKCYINANYVKGYEGKAAIYIACQAPLPEGIEDFWRMVWEQQSRVIVMLTMFEENGTSRCAVYFPQSTLISQQPFGDFQVSLLKKDVYEFYTVSNLRLLDLEKNLFRDVVHVWFTGWPDVGVPKDPSSLVTFVQQCRPFVNSNTGPTVVHCSTGTGRTGVFLALDICMREYDQSRSIDILQCVSQLRRDRAGSVQNKDQYVLIHEALLEYISRVNNNQSRRSSMCNN